MELVSASLLEMSEAVSLCAEALGLYFLDLVFRVQVTSLGDSRAHIVNATLQVIETSAQPLGCKDWCSHGDSN